MIFYFKCDCNHIVLVDMPQSKINNFIRQINKLSKVCPHCKPENVKLNYLKDYQPDNKWGDKLELICNSGHVTTISCFADGTLHCSWGTDENQFMNINEYDKDSIQQMLDDKHIKCFHVIKEKLCNKKLKIASGNLSIPCPPAIKTKTRVGDIWDKAKVPEPKHSTYSQRRIDGRTVVADYNETEFDRRLKRRSQDMKEGKMQVFDDKAGKNVTIKRDRVVKKGPDIEKTL